MKEFGGLLPRVIWGYLVAMQGLSLLHSGCVLVCVRATDTDRHCFSLYPSLDASLRMTRGWNQKETRFSHKLASEYMAQINSLWNIL